MQRIRGSTRMRYINLLLLTYLLTPVNRTSEKEHHRVMGGKKKYIEMFVFHGAIQLVKSDGIPGPVSQVIGN